MGKYLFVLFSALCFVGIHNSNAQNSVVAYLEAETPSALSDFPGGASFQANMPLSEYLDLQAGFRVGNYFPSVFGTAKVGLTIFPAAKNHAWQIDNAVVFDNYSPYPLNRLYYRIIGSWSCDHFRVDVGNAFMFTIGDGISKYNLFRPLMALKVTIRKPDKIWNASLFVRNFNRFESHAQDMVEWGVVIPVQITGHWMMFCESYLSTVGNFSGTANYYNCNVNLGVTYKW